MAYILAGIYCLRENQWSPLPGKLKRNSSSPLSLPCCVWPWVVLDQVAEAGSVSCGCSELGWSGCLCLPGLEKLHLMLCSWALLTGARAACRLFLEIFSLYVHIRVMLSAVLQALVQDGSSASLWKGGYVKGWEREEGHMEREYGTPCSIIASVNYSNAAAEMVLISSLWF